MQNEIKQFFYRSRINKHRINALTSPNLHPSHLKHLHRRLGFHPIPRLEHDQPPDDLAQLIPFSCKLCIRRRGDDRLPRYRRESGVHLKGWGWEFGGRGPTRRVGGAEGFEDW